MMFLQSRTPPVSVSRSSVGGFSTIELIVSMTLMAAVMAFAAPMVYRLDRIWKDTAEQRIAMFELSNQLERLVELTPEQLDETLSVLVPSKLCREQLHQPQLSATLVNDSLGKRITLELSWERKVSSRPVQLAAWVPATLRSEKDPTTEKRGAVK